jgi:UV DNA damage endonuclease
MKIGYPCINLSLSCRSSKTFRLASYSDENMKQTIENNLDCLMKILLFNKEHDLLFFRISSDLIPFASHPVCTFPWQTIYQKKFRDIGRFIKAHNIRVSMHPDQFVLINSLDKAIFDKSVKELLYHIDVLDLLDVDGTGKVQIHVGGVYGDKARSMKRFIKRYGALPKKIKQRLVIENDARLYSIDDCLDMHKKTGIPVVFDVLHHACNNSGEPMIKSLSKAFDTWKVRDGLPIVDYSSQKKNKKIGSHAVSLNVKDFRAFINQAKIFDFDIMCEIKNKEKVALRALRVLREVT